MSIVLFFNGERGFSVLKKLNKSFKISKVILENKNYIKKVSSIATSVISAPDIFGRIGGEEFLAVIFNNSKEHLQQICEKVRSTVENDETLFDNQKIRVTISGGVCFTDESTSVSDMVNKADERLYLAKKNGRNKFYLNEGE